MKRFYNKMKDYSNRHIVKNFDGNFKKKCSILSFSFYNSFICLLLNQIKLIAIFFFKLFIN